jgi:hypothetical protein
MTFEKRFTHNEVEVVCYSRDNPSMKRMGGEP